MMETAIRHGHALHLPEVSATQDGIDELEAWLVNARLEGVLVQSEEILATGRQLGDQAFSRFAASLLSASVEFARRTQIDAIHTGIQIQYIDLSGNCLTDTAAAALAECLAWIREHFGGHVLRSLRLSRNDIGPSGGEDVALKFFPLGALSREQRKEYDLDLSENPLGDLGVSLLAKAVQRRDCHAVLQLRDVGCGAEGCRSLTQCFQTLKGLDLSQNDIPEAEVNALAAKLPRSSRFALPGLSQISSVTVAAVAAVAAVSSDHVKDSKATGAISRAQAALERARLALGKDRSSWSPASISGAGPGARLPRAPQPSQVGSESDTMDPSISASFITAIPGQRLPDQRTSAKAQAVLDRARLVLSSKTMRHGSLQATLQAPGQEQLMPMPPMPPMPSMPPTRPMRVEAAADLSEDLSGAVMPHLHSKQGVILQLRKEVEVPQLPQAMDGVMQTPLSKPMVVPQPKQGVPTAAELGGSQEGQRPQSSQSSDSSSCKSPAFDRALGEVASLQQALGQLAGGLGLAARSPSLSLSDENEPDAEALAMPERTVRLEREVAELREDVRRIEHTVSSLQVEPEQEDGIEAVPARDWAEKIKPRENEDLKPENGTLALDEEDMCSMPSIASLKAEKDMRESDFPLSPKSPKAPPKGKGKGKGPPLPGKASPQKPEGSPSARASPAGPGAAEAAEGAQGAQAAVDLLGPPGPPPATKGKGKAKGAKGGSKGGKGPPPPAKGPPPKAPAAKAAPKSQAKAESKAPFHKKLYWKQVDIADAEGTIFSQESRARSNTCSAIDFNALSKILEAEKTKGSQLQRRSSGVLSKAQMRNIGTKVLSDHRARNIAIVLKRMPTSTTDLVHVLSSLRWEDDRISSDDLEQILEAIPTHDEAKKLREHSAPEDCQKLRDVEQMVMPLTLLSRSSARVRVLCIARNARLHFKSTMRSLARIRAACLAIQGSGMLRNVMLLALELGNFVNHGDSKKGAKAIAISSLLALRDFKFSEGISMLHFLCASVMRSDANANAAQILQKELLPAERIAKMQVQGLSAAMKSFTRDLDTIKSECQNYLAEYEGADTAPAESDGEEDAKEFGQELAEVQAAAAAAACDMLDSPLKTQREDEDATRWVEDVMKIRGSAQRRLRCMRRILEKLCNLLKADMDSTAVQVHATLRFCGVMLPRASSSEVPTDIEALLSNLSEFTKVFKEHWDEVKKNMSHYQQLFSDSASSS